MINKDCNIGGLGHPATYIVTASREIEYPDAEKLVKLLKTGVKFFYGEIVMKGLAPVVLKTQSGFKAYVDDTYYLSHVKQLFKEIGSVFGVGFRFKEFND